MYIKNIKTIDTKHQKGDFLTQKFPQDYMFLFSGLLE